MVAAGNPLHASCVVIGGRALLIAGRSGSGKSDLAMRLIDRGAALLSDDYTELVARAGRLIARPPSTIAGKIELRGVGILDMPHVGEAPVALLLDLDRSPERLPEEPLASISLQGISIPALGFAPFEASAPIKAEQALLLHGVGGSQ
ncbi:HPr kinase/phosphorylase [Rhizorhabdus sp. FW153]|uniref:HPr kinase/phosphorylase n=1 Tax=Rhizorhabdus sp. FW153 TaxID=3400216 RepID=UPI003CF8E99F